MFYLMKACIVCKFEVVNEFTSMPNLRVKCDKHPADYCVIFYGSEVISVFNFVVGACALRE